MNKRFSTLLAAALVAGGLSSTGMAQIANPQRFQDVAASEVASEKVEEGFYYHLGTTGGKHLSFLTDATDKKVYLQARPISSSSADAENAPVNATAFKAIDAARTAATFFKVFINQNSFICNIAQFVMHATVYCSFIIAHILQKVNTDLKNCKKYTKSCVPQKTCQYSFRKFLFLKFRVAKSCSFQFLWKSLAFSISLWYNTSNSFFAVEQQSKRYFSAWHFRKI